MLLQPPYTGPPTLPPELVRAVLVHVFVEYMERAFDLTNPLALGVHHTPEPEWDAIRTATQVDYVWRNEAVALVSNCLGVEWGVNGR